MGRTASRFVCMVGLLGLACSARAAGPLFDGFENGLSEDWHLQYGLPGYLQVLNSPVHSGSSALQMKQPEGSTYLTRCFPEGFQGTIAVWQLFPETRDGTDPRPNAAGSLLLVQGDPVFEGGWPMDYTVEGLDGDSTGVLVSSQYHSQSRPWGDGGTDTGEGGAFKRWRINGGGWHCLRIQVSGNGAQGWYDGQAIPLQNPELTCCRSVSLGVDWNFRGAVVWDDFSAIPARLDVGIDIKPDSFPNSINLGSNGTVPVAILSTPDFDATQVDPATVTLASAYVKLKGQGTPMCSLQDVNNDGLPDLIVHVVTEALQLTGADTTATLEGKAFDGQCFIRGTDSIRVVP